MFKLRILFEKKDEASYISHLDLMRSFQRSFCRAKLPVKYSEGFNPHICMSILSPLSTGFRSEYELCDVELVSDEMPKSAKESLIKALPRGIIVLDVFEAKTRAADMDASVYRVVAEGGDAEHMEELFKSSEILCEKKSKKGIRTVNICDYIKEISFKNDAEGTVIDCKLSMGEDQINPSHIVKTLRERGFLPEDGAVTCTRTAILDKNNQLFR